MRGIEKCALYIVQTILVDWWIFEKKGENNFSNFRNSCDFVSRLDNIICNVNWFDEVNNMFLSII